MHLRRKYNKFLSKRRLTKCFLTIIIINIIFYIKHVGIIDDNNSNNTPYYNLKYYNFHSSNSNNKTDWHDRKAMMEELSKIGLGEQGEAAYLPPNERMSKKRYAKQVADTGYNARLSDIISFTRSVPDIRHKACKTKQYLSDLPNASIIIVFFNEHWSILLRGVHSVINRTPENLLYEIILVDDFSDKYFLVNKLDNYIAQNLTKVKLIRLKKRSGLITARLTGAEAATGEVLVFLDAHVETNYNWLPPLLEPIAYNPKVVVCPLIDTINYETFKYSSSGEGARGGLNWGFDYMRYPLLPEDLKDPTKPYRSAVMYGGFFAMNRKWFWELGGYDPKLDIWGGEQFEISFKIWMCGGELLEVICSRVGHVYRGGWVTKNVRSYDFIRTNYKRVAEVWMDEYGKLVYQSDVDAYKLADTGDLSDRRALRKRLKCKSFKWFMENIAFDSLREYPPVPPPSFAYGSIQSMANKTLCLDSLMHGNEEEPGLFQCSEESLNGNASYHQNWKITWRKDFRLNDINSHLCLDATEHHEYAKIMFGPCHHTHGNQCWFYDHSKKLLIQGRTEYCLEANIKNLTVYINKCNDDNINMKWEFSSYNVTGLKRFYIDWPIP